MALSLPFTVIAFLALIVASQVADFDIRLNYVGERDLVDSGVGWFPLIWLIGAIPFFFMILLSKQCCRPTNRYWTLLLGAFFGLSAIGFWLDHVAYQLIINHSTGS